MTETAQEQILEQKLKELREKQERKCHCSGTIKDLCAEDEL